MIPRICRGGGLLPSRCSIGFFPATKFSNPNQSPLRIIIIRSPRPLRQSQQNPQQKSPNMRPPSHAPTNRSPRNPQRTNPAKKLHHKPKRNKNPSRQTRRKPNNKKRHQSQNPRSRIKQNERTKHPRNCPASPNRRNPRTPTKCRLRHSRTDPANQIKSQIPNRPESILHIRPKN